jgi:putative oxidoreductase
MENYQLHVFEFLIRVFTGVVFLFQGYDKLFNVKLKQVVDTFDDEAEKKHIPKVLVVISSFYSSLAESIGGLFLILGVLKPIALTLLGIDLIMVAVAFSSIEAMWDMKHVFPRLVLISILMIIPSQWELFSLSKLFQHQFNWLWL